ncbi:MAG: RNA chaperone Hfq [Candidatus Coatesbacteria bacterium]|nr:RNA chaperone Hfq [Candidatus Coatesbacteria bacterium]
MTNPLINIQDTFLNIARIRNIPVTIILINGDRLSGRIQGFDKFTVILDGSGKEQQMVFKHAIASVSPAEPIKDLFRPQSRKGEGA